jgi:hypothetical protein
MADPTSGSPALRWQPQPAAHDYDAAASYLSLTVPPKAARALAEQLRDADIVTFKAKDILRASGLPLLPRDNPDVAKQLGHIAAGGTLSPCLLVRGDLTAGRPAQIADGYHRVCASNYTDEDADIPVKIVGL